MMLQENKRNSLMNRSQSAPITKQMKYNTTPFSRGNDGKIPNIAGNHPKSAKKDTSILIKPMLGARPRTHINIKRGPNAKY